MYLAKSLHDVWYILRWFLHSKIISKAQLANTNFFGICRRKYQWSGEKTKNLEVNRPNAFSIIVDHNSCFSQVIAES